jgi:diadenylate cyclase
MELFQRANLWFEGLRARLATYSPWEVGVELFLIWIVVYLIVRFVQGTRAAGALKGLLVLVAVIAVLSRFLGTEGSFHRLGLLYDKLLALVAIGLIVIFQPELRRGLVRLGETSVLRGTRKDVRFIADEISDAVRYLSKARFGALIVIERQSRLGGLVEGGTRLNAELSSQLLQTIFFPGSALHDLACVVRGKVIEAAGVQLPLADPGDMPSKQLGSRHRAALGLSQECDAIIVVVSEETAAIRIADKGKLSSPMTPDEFETALLQLLSATNLPVTRVAGGATLASSAGDPRSDTSVDGASGLTLAGGSVLGETNVSENSLGDSTGMSSALGDTFAMGSSGEQTPEGSTAFGSVASVGASRESFAASAEAMDNTLDAPGLSSLSRENDQTSMGLSSLSDEMIADERALEKHIDKAADKRSGHASDRTSDRKHDGKGRQA